MVTFTASSPVDMTALNITPDHANTTQGAALSNLTLGGITYPTAVQVVWSYGGVQHTSVLAGVGIVTSIVGSNFIITAGTITGYLDFVGASPPANPFFSITGANYSAAAFYNATLAPSTAENTAELRAIFAGADIIVGSSGDDILSGFGGNASIDGGGGVNTVVFAGTASQYTVSTAANGVTTVTDSVAGRDGTDTLTNIQQLRFSDKTTTLAVATPPQGTIVVTNLTSSQDLLVYQIYQAAYGRTPDNAGFVYWAGIADTNHTSAISLADSFLAAPEFTQLYGVNPTNTTYVTGLYTHVLGRSPDAGGLAYWVGQADSGQPRDQLLVDFAISAENVQLIAPHVSNGYWTT